ncbi:MAG: glycosyltransferase family 4 protein [Burkholderiales bacterium]
MRIGFALEAAASWLGGANYLRSLIGAILSVPGRPATPVLFAAPGEAERWQAEFPTSEVVATRLLERGSGAWLVRKLLLRPTGIDAGLRALARRHRIDLLSHSGTLGLRAGTPTLCWIADLQHRRLPEFCDPAEFAAREATIGRWQRDAAALLFSSQAARADFERFYAPGRTPLHVVPFVPSTRTPDLANVPFVLERLGILQPFFYVPNQFWLHKNHRLVIEAALRLHKAGVAVQVVFTGAGDDYRGRGHLDSLRALAGPLEDRVRFLGVVAYEEVMALMEGCIAVINPSLFEGWSTTVEEARNLGKLVLLSDIDTHREQAPPRGVYFDAQDADDLAHRMREASAAFVPEMEASERNRHMPDVAARQRAFGAAYIRVAKSVVDGQNVGARAA